MIKNHPFAFLRDFMRAEVPDPGRGKLPKYYRTVLVATNLLMSVLCLIILILGILMNHRIEWLGVALMMAVMLKSALMDEMTMRTYLLVHTLVVCAWSGWYVYQYGWNSGGQHLLIPLLMLIFFSVYVRPATKILYFFLLIFFRMGLFYYSEIHAPQVVMGTGVATVFQSVNSLFMFIIAAVNCIVFSTSIQETERQLLLVNQELQHEAETDELTQLPNRRSIFEEMSLFIRNNPSAQFCVAIADIDFFKKVNDTYGHNCGDYTLQRLAACFRDNALGRYRCGRWGGEEFCFFFPDMNLDDAGNIMRDVNMEASYLDLEFEGKSFRITITAGVEECDFRSGLDEIIERADRKLYLGKSSGRNCVIV